MHPVLSPFGSEDRWISFLSKFVTSDSRELEIARMLIKRKIVPVVHGSELAYYMGVSPKLITHMAKRPSKYYNSFYIPKKNGKRRLITAPRVFLKAVQRYILDTILVPVPVHGAACAFLPETNCAVGARRHVGKRFLWNIDLKDFFPSISQAKVEALFGRFGYPAQAARLLSNLTCLDGCLPQGAPTSPMISNHVFAEIDTDIATYCCEHDITYSRYADDLSFSSEAPIRPLVMDKVGTFITRNGFKINESKTRLMGPRCRREVTGLTVNTQVSIPRSRRRKLRAMFHQVALSPASFGNKKRMITGYALWVKDYHAEGLHYLKIARSIPAE